MKRLDAVVYDLEIANAVLADGESKVDGIKYCSGWGDHTGMGISVLAAMDMLTGRPHVFLKDNLTDFLTLVTARQHLVGFNSLRFDDKVFAAAVGVSVRTTFDLKVHIDATTGKRAAGRKLDDFVKTNLGRSSKAMEGRMAPIKWQLGNIGEVISYCMGDVHDLAELISLDTLIDPVTGKDLGNVCAPLYIPTQKALELDPAQEK